MKRKLLTYLCIGIMAVSMVGCGHAEIVDSSKSDTVDTKTTTDEDVTTEEETTKKKKPASDDEDETTEEETTKKKKPASDDEDETTEEETTKKKKPASDDEDETTEEETTKKGEKPSSDVDTSDWTSHSGTGYSLSAPDNWTEYDYESSDLTLANIDSSFDDFAENITVVLQDTSSYNLDIESYKDLSLKQYEQLNYTVISTEKCTIDGNDGYYLVCTTETSGVLCYCFQFFTIVDDTAYIFTFAADSDGYQDLADEVEDIYSTIKFD